MPTLQCSRFKFGLTSFVAVATLLTALMVQPAFSAAAKSKAPAGPRIVKVVDVYGADPITFKRTGKTISLTLAPEEYGAAPLLVGSPKAIPGARIELAADLASGGSKLAKTNVSAWVVLDGVLRKDDTLRTTGDPVYDLPAGGKGFWLDVYVPKRTKPGTYKGTVLVSTDKHIGSIPIEVKVLPMRLLRSSKQYGMLIPFTISSVTPDTYESYLQSLYSAGFCVSALPEPPASAVDAFAAYKASRLGVHGIYAGFLCGEQTVSQADVLAVAAARRKSGASELFFLGADRPADDAALEAAKARLEVMRSCRVRTAARVDSSSTYDALKDYVNAFIYSPDSDYVNSLFGGKTRSNGKREWYYWDASKDAMQNRVYAGVELWKSNLDGAYVEPGEVDYNALSEPDPSALLVPADGGVLPTVKWEALRNGIDDTRYLTTMMAVLREAKDQKVGKSVTSEAEAYINSFLEKPFDSLTSSDLDKFRSKLAQYTIKLRGMVKP